MKTYKQTILSIVLGLALAAGLSYAATWTGPLIIRRWQTPKRP